MALLYQNQWYYEHFTTTSILYICNLLKKLRTQIIQCRSLIIQNLWIIGTY